MAKNQALNNKLEQIQQLRQAASTPQTVAELRKHLAAKTNVVVAKAARVTAEAELADLLPDLRAAFVHFMQNGEKTDKACIAKIALIKALRKLEDSDLSLFVQGIRYQQLEASFGGKIDTAVDIRCECAYALVEQAAPEALNELITLAFDAELAAQIAAVRAMASTGRYESELLLRMLATSRACDQVVVGECLACLMQLAPDTSFDFVAAYLSDADEALQQASALALAQTHSSKAFDILRDHWDDAPGFKRRLLILPFATLRLPEAVDFLLNTVEFEPDTLAREAVQALKIYQHDNNVTSRLRDIVAAKSSHTLSEAWRRIFS